MRKRRVLLLAVVLSVHLPAPGGPASSAVEFYKPNREARLVVTLKNKLKYSAQRPVTVTVMLTNQALTPLLINNRLLINRYPLEGELSFVIQGPDSKPCPLLKSVTPREMNAGHLAVIGVGETMEQAADLTALYGVKKRGKYRIQVIYYNRVDLEKDGLTTWRGTIASEPTEIILH